MSGSIRGATNKLGRPKTTGKGESVNLRLLPQLMGALDAHIAAQPEPRPSRPEAIRRLLAEALDRVVETARPAISDEAALPEIPKSDAEPYDGSPI
jgi:hypothetical protein